MKNISSQNVYCRRGPNTNVKKNDVYSLHLNASKNAENIQIHIRRLELKWDNCQL